MFMGNWVFPESSNRCFSLYKIVSLQRKTIRDDEGRGGVAWLVNSTLIFIPVAGYWLLSKNQNIPVLFLAVGDLILKVCSSYKIPDAFIL